MRPLHPGTRWRHVGIIAVLLLCLCFIADVQTELVYQVLIGAVVASMIAVSFLRWWA